MINWQNVMAASALLLATSAATIEPVDPIRFTYGPWSQSQDGLRGRLVVSSGRELAEGALHEHVVYLELQYFPPAATDSIKVYFDPALKCEMRDPQNVLVPQRGRGYNGGGGGQPTAQWVTLPYDATLQLRLSPYGYGTDDGIRINIGSDEWNIEASDRGEYALSGQFVSEPSDQDSGKIWRGMISLPAVRLSASKEPIVDR